jgi:ATP-dependent Clp protease ATP-binding subunit ClpA
MFERFTADARDVVTQARVEADAARDPQIGAVHLLLGCAAGTGPSARMLAAAGLAPETLRAALAELRRVERRPDADALRAIGIELDEVTSRVEGAFGPGALERTRAATGRRRGRSGRLDRDARKALELALRHALALGDHHVGAEHVLLGVLHVRGAAVEAILRHCRASADDLSARARALGREQRPTGT